MLPSLGWIMAAGLAIGLFAGFVMHRADFCLAAAFRDVFLFHDASKLRSVAVLVVASALLFETARRLGLLAFYPFPLLGPPSLVNFAGGALFGLGMVLAGGCVVGTLYKMGAGSLASVAAFGGLLAGSALYAAIHPAWASLAGAATFFRGRATVPQFLRIDPAAVVAAAAIPAGWLLFRQRAAAKRRGPAGPRGYIGPWTAAVLLAVAGAASYVAVGMPLGITTSYAKLAAYVDSALLGGAMSRAAYFRTVPLDVVNPVTGLGLRGGPGPVFDAIAAVQAPVIAGIVLGGAASALSLREFGLRWRIPPAQLLAAFAGGAIMGLASRMAPGCNVWHLMGGLPVFAFQSILFVSGLFPGAWLGSRALVKIVA